MNTETVLRFVLAAAAAGLAGSAWVIGRQTYVPTARTLSLWAQIPPLTTACIFWTYNATALPTYPLTGNLLTSAWLSRVVMVLFYVGYAFQQFLIVKASRLERDAVYEFHDTDPRGIGSDGGLSVRSLMAAVPVEPGQDPSRNARHQGRRREAST